MKSRISFFDGTTFKKDITRFIPLWVLYTISTLLTMLPIVYLSTFWQHPASLLDSSLGILSLSNLVYGALTSQLLFGELFQSRLCNALHAMPVTRTARFGSHICAGLLFSLVPNLLTALLMLPALGSLWFTAFLWLTVMTLEYVFFFGVGVFSTLCTGSRFAMVAVYSIINFFSLIVLWFVNSVYAPMMPGVDISGSNFIPFCPVVQMISTDEYFIIGRLYTGIRENRSLLAGLNNYYPATFKGFGDGWIYLLICAGIGILAIVIALLLYRRRHLESAGDFIAFKWLAPVFLVLYTLCVCAFVSLFGALFSLHIPFLIIGLIIGFFTGKMLLARTIRVFRGKSFLQLGAFLLAMLLSFGAVSMDLFGIVRYVPDVEDVDYIVYDSSYSYNQKLTDPEDIEMVRTIHSMMVESYCDRDCGATHKYLQIEYHLKDGRVVSRYYYICQGTAAYTLLADLPEYE